MHRNYIFKAIASLFILLSASCAMFAQALAPNVNPNPTALRAGNYALDPNHAALTFKIDHLGFSNYVGRFNRFDVSLDFDEADPAAARIEAVIDMTSLDIANDEFANVLMGPSWFDANQFPEAILRSTAGVGLFGQQLRVPGGTSHQNRPRFPTLKALQVVSASQYAFTAGSTDNRRVHQGWGFPNLATMWNMRQKTFIVDETAVIMQAVAYQWR